MKQSFKIKTTYMLALLGMVFLFATSVSAQDGMDEEGVILDTTLDINGNASSSEEVAVELAVDQIGIDPAEAPSIANEPTAPLENIQAELDNTNSAVDNAGQPDVLVPLPHSGTYFDASSIGAPEFTNSPAPREVDPLYEPGSSFVVVTKSAGPNSMSARLVAAQRAISLGRYSSALELYQQLYKDNPKSHQVLMGLAVAQQKSGFTESAIATYEELLKHDPDNADAMANMLGLIKTQYPAIAYRRLQDLWQKNPTNAYIASELALISASVNELEEAIRYMGIASSLEPDNASHYYNMAVIYDRANDVVQAIELYQKALEVDITFGAGRSIAREQVYDRLAYLRRL